VHRRRGDTVAQIDSPNPTHLTRLSAAPPPGAAVFR